MLNLFDPGVGRGLEVGPLFDPVVRRGDADIHYVDLYPGNALREYYSTHEGIPVADIVDPDFVLAGPDGIRTLPEAVAEGAPFHWVIASHVIEHVPDVIGWLHEVASILDEGGQLILAVPDRRYCFDAVRDPTTVGEMLLAHHHRDRTPSVRAVYDHHRNAVVIDSADAWRGKTPDVTDRVHDLKYTLDRLQRATEFGEYVDCHVWLFTPESFVRQMAELRLMDLSPFVVSQIVPTAELELEFYAVLTKLPSDGDQPDLDLRETSVQQPSAERVEPLSPREVSLVVAKRRIMGKLRPPLAAARSHIRDLGRRKD